MWCKFRTRILYVFIWTFLTFPCFPCAAGFGEFSCSTAPWNLFPAAPWQRCVCRSSCLNRCLCPNSQSWVLSANHNHQKLVANADLKTCFWKLGRLKFGLANYEWMVMGSTRNTLDFITEVRFVGGVATGTQNKPCKHDVTSGWRDKTKPASLSHLWKK